jgi:hypothetical protein
MANREMMIAGNLGFRRNPKSEWKIPVGGTT